MGRGRVEDIFYGDDLASLQQEDDHSDEGRWRQTEGLAHLLARLPRDRFLQPSTNGTIFLSEERPFVIAYPGDSNSEGEKFKVEIVMEKSQPFLSLAIYRSYGDRFVREVYRGRSLEELVRSGKFLSQGGSMAGCFSDDEEDIFLGVRQTVKTMMNTPRNV